jgi:hypothetical protein
LMRYVFSKRLGFFIREKLRGGLSSPAVLKKSGSRYGGGGHVRLVSCLFEAYPPGFVHAGTGTAMSWPQALRLGGV